MRAKNKSRRDFLGAAMAGGAAALTDPGGAAAQVVGIKRGDLPDLTIKQVKVHVLKPDERRARTKAGPRSGEKFAAIVTHSGIEGNYDLPDRYYHPNWSNLGWLDHAKGALAGKSVLDLPKLTSQWAPACRELPRLWQEPFAGDDTN